MAKYRLRNSNNVVKCEVLNESKNEFVVRFNNGVIQKVPKYRVSNLDRIDEGTEVTFYSSKESGSIDDFASS